MKTRAGKIAVVTVVVLAAAIWAAMYVNVQAATYQYKQKSITLTADATPLDGQTAGREYTSGDRTAAACIPLDSETDGVVITMHGTGASGSVVFNIFGYGFDGGPAEMIYASATGTAGTADYSTTGHFIGTVTGTNTHCSAGGVRISDSGNNRVAKIAFDTMGYKYLLFEVTTLTTLTDITFDVRQIGYK